MHEIESQELIEMGVLIEPFFLSFLSVESFFLQTQRTGYELTGQPPIPRYLGLTEEAEVGWGGVTSRRSTSRVLFHNFGWHPHCLFPHASSTPLHSLLSSALPCMRF